MKPYLFRFSLKLALFLTFFGQSISAELFKPNIQNYGLYKYYDWGAAQSLTPLIGHVPKAANDSIKLLPVAHDQLLDLSIVLKLNNEEELDSRLVAITHPRSAKYQEFLSQDEFINTYSPTIEQVEQTKSYLENHGLTVSFVDKNRLIIHATGLVSAINEIFHTEIYNYINHAGETFYAPAYELQIEENLPILSVMGLENIIKARPYFKRLNPDASVSGFTPATIKDAYSIPSTLNGSGQTLGLFELDGFTKSDITGYEKAFGLPNVALEVVLIDGATGTPGDGAAEVTLDIELMIAVAPGASKIIVYEGPNSGQGLIDTYNKIATDNLAKSVSTSWGLTESSTDGATIQAENTIFKQIAAQGQSIYAAAGDSGAYDNGTTLTVDDPASQPFVVGVGGTNLSTNSDGSYNSEKTWSSGNGPGNNGGGGGISSIWPIPSWQEGAPGAGSLGSSTMRNVPDVSLDADPQTGYAVYFQNQWQVYGGTSCAAPLWAGLTALVNQNRSELSQGPLGFANPILYQIGKSTNYDLAFHDIHDGSTNGYYPAVVGYDLATGLGTYIGSSLITLLSGSTTPTPPPPTTCTHVNPALTITPTSQRSVPGGVLVYRVVLTNKDSASCSSSTFALTSTSPTGFIEALSESDVILSPTQSSTVVLFVLSPTEAAHQSYSFTVSAVNSSAPSFSAFVSGTYIVE